MFSLIGWETTWTIDNATLFMDVDNFEVFTARTLFEYILEVVVVSRSRILFKLNPLYVSDLLKEEREAYNEAHPHNGIRQVRWVNPKLSLIHI